MLKKFKTLLEFVKKEETEHWTIWLLEHWKFAKEISKLAKKFWFDCYAKWYPEEKVDYVPTGEKILIKTVEDIAKLSPKQFEFFIEDLRSWCKYRKEVDNLQNLGIKVETTEWMIWLDTWLHEEKIEVQVSFSNKL